MKRFCLIAALSSLLLCAACSTPPESREDFSLSVPLLLQETSERVFADFVLEEIAPLLPPDSLHWPGSTRLTEHGVFVIEYSDAHVWLYDLEGNLVQTFGAGKGEGPGEMLNPIDIVVLGDTVAVLDAYSWSVHRFLMDGAYIESDETPFQGFHMSASAKTILIHGYGSEYVLVRYPVVDDDSIITLFTGLGRLDGNRTSGYLTSDDRQFAYVNRALPFFVMLSADGDVEYARATVDHATFEMPEMPELQNGVRRPPPALHSGVAITGNLLMIESVRDRSDSTLVVDLYDMGNHGAYAYSIQMPFRGANLSVLGDMMAARTGPDTASLFRFDVEE